MTGKHNKHLRVNNLSISRGHDGVWRVRSPERPHRVLKESPGQEEAYRWAHGHREFAHKEPVWTDEELEYLADNYGLLPVEKIAKHLNRSTNDLKIVGLRKFNHQMHQSVNLNTARSVARAVGVG